MISKEEVKKIIKWLNQYYSVIHEEDTDATQEDLDGISEIVDKLETYLKKDQTLKEVTK
tara:strand:+ start:187 stop:363 length:177 start_codon:yes stop_codon:yes gene_type:complete